jgi:DNA-binding response OmpR family regulator
MKERAHLTRARVPVINLFSPPENKTPMRSRPVVILYVEENRMLLQTVCDVLEFAGWYVKRCSDSFYARALLEQEEHFDLLLLDHELRGMSGTELARRARRLPHRQETPIILISLEDCREEARRAGADAFLRKPNNLIELVDTIRRLLVAPDSEKKPS